MQVFTSYFFSVKFLIVVILCVQNVIANLSPDTTRNPSTITTESSLIRIIKEKNSTVLPTTVALTTENTSILASETADNSKSTDSTTIFSITLKNFIDGLTTSTTENSKTTTDITFTENSTTDIAFAENTTTDITFAKNTTTDIAFAENTTTDITLAENTTTDITFAENTTTDIAFAENTTTYITFAKNTTTDIAFAENTTTDITLAENTTTDIIFAENTTTDITLAENITTDITFAENTTTDITFAENTITDITFAENTTTDIIFAENTITDITFAENTATDITFAENTIRRTPFTTSNIENITTTIQIDNTITTEQPGAPNTSTTTVVSTESTTFPFNTTDSTISTVPENSTTPTTENITTTTQFTTTLEPPCVYPDSFNATVTDILKTEVHGTIIALPNNTICPTQIYITCNATGEENNLNWTWVVQFQALNFTINDTNTYDFVLGNLSEFTNYSCEFLLDNLTDLTSFQTKPEVPSSPVQLYLTSVTSTSFNVSWNEPEKIPSILEGYEVTILRGEVASNGHFWNCSEEDTYTKNVTGNSLLFEEALADFVYNVYVKARSNVGYSDPTNGTVNTLAAASGPPESVTREPIEIPGLGNIEMREHFTWDMPCDTKGSVSYFQIKLLGFYLYNTSRTDFRAPTVNISQGQTSYSYNFTDIWAASNYTFKIYLMGNKTGIVYDTSFLTADNYPSAPSLDTWSVTSQNLTITWEEPSNHPGKIDNYTVHIEGKINWEPTKYCNVNYAEYNATEYVPITKYFTEKVAPGADYLVSFSAITSRGQGNPTNQSITSNMTYPDPFAISSQIKSDQDTEEYNANVTINFEPGCINGQFRAYGVGITGTREGYEDYSAFVWLTGYHIHQYNFNLKAEYFYTVNLTIMNEQYNKTNWINFTAPAGVPAINNSFISSIPITAESTSVSLTLKQKFFDERQGSLMYLAIIVSDENITGGTFSRWEDSSQWPSPTGSSNVYYQATPKFWNPFSEFDTIEYVIGSDSGCSDDQYCNTPLEPGKQYFVLVRLFNDNYYRNTMPISIITNKINRIGMILGIIAGLLFLAIQGFVFFVLWKKGIIKLNHNENHGNRDVLEDRSLLRNVDVNSIRTRQETQDPKTEIAKKRFVAYTKNLEENPELLTAQWNELENESKTVYNELPNRFALFPENKRKNRFINILPFDHSRVKLKIDEDDEICSDYINASYIKGFSGENEYIATQGPLSGTCRDFWKMVLQENVSIIVMVSRFIENNRDKCYKYFPNNRETTTIGDDIEVRCSMELHFGFYCIRTLQVKKELQQITVTHMQFLEWPDFGVPTGTESMLNFCHQFQERWATEGGMALVHCSAGVGRTGTILATDILLRVLAAGKKIDVFNTVLELRRQRKSMVQTEKQYMYIHQLIASMIEFPIPDEQDNPEHLYENVDLRNKNGIVESSL